MMEDIMEAGLTNGYKIHWAVKLCAFVGSVVTLSWFFAGWRQVNEAQTPANWLLLAAGVVMTVLLLGLQGYWIYFEEKAKGTLRKRVELFERIYRVLHDRPKS